MKDTDCLSDGSVIDTADQARLFRGIVSPNGAVFVGRDLNAAVMDVYEIKKQYGDRLAFFGGVGVQSILPHGRPKQILAEVYRLIDEVGKGGGFIIGPSHAMPGDIPIENMIAMIEAFHHQ